MGSSSLMASPKFNEQALNLFEVSKSEGPDSPIAQEATKKLAKTYWLELNQSMDLVKTKIHALVGKNTSGVNGNKIPQFIQELPPCGVS